MIIEQRIKDFERLGLGMFVHFGLYSVLGKGEWAKWIHKISHEDYEPLKNKFSWSAYQALLLQFILYTTAI